VTPPSRLLPSALFFICVCVGLGCSPGIASFRAEPNVVCSGSPTTLSWTASHDGTLSAVPADAALGAVGESGTQAVTPAAATTYRLTVKRLWKTVTREVGVEVITAPSEAKQIGASVADPSTTCEANTLALTVTAPASAWDPHIQITSVALVAGVNRTYVVEHAGRSATLAPGAPSNAFAGLPVQGNWRLSTPLGPTEACGRNVPRSLLIDVSSTCAR
jgi:hypothetical protein